MDAHQLKKDLDVPGGLGGDLALELPATRYTQGGRTQFHLSVTIEYIPRLVLNRPDPDKPLPLNRKVKLSRARAFGKYFRQRPAWVSPAIIVRVPAGEMEFTEIHTFADGTAWGVLKIPFQALLSLEVLDGQHRTLGLFLALEETVKEIRKARDTLQKMKDEGVPGNAIPDQEKYLKRQLAIEDRLRKEHISVDVVAVSDDEQKQMFADINNNAVGVNKDFTTILDQSKVVNRIAVALIDSHVLLEDRVESGQGSRFGQANENLMGAKNVGDIVHGVIVGTGRVGAQREKELEADPTAAEKKVSKFLDLLVDAFPDLQQVARGDLSPKDLRQKSLLGSTTMLRVLAAVYHDLSEPPKPATGPQPLPLSQADIRDYFSRLAPHMGAIPIKDDDDIWLPTGAFLPGGNAPQARQGSIKSLVDAMVDWARNGNPKL